MLKAFCSEINFKFDDKLANLSHNYLIWFYNLKLRPKLLQNTGLEENNSFVSSIDLRKCSVLFTKNFALNFVYRQLITCHAAGNITKTSKHISSLGIYLSLNIGIIIKQSDRIFAGIW